LGLLERRAAPDPENPTKKPIRHILVDTREFAPWLKISLRTPSDKCCPGHTAGQIEVFVWSASGTILLESLASSFPTVIAYIIDTPRTASTSTFMSNMLYACSILYKTKLPMILVFNKTDIKDASFAKEWMTDYEAFQAALQEDEANNAFGGNEGGDGMGMGSGYMGSLLNSMSLMLEEFYTHLSVVGVSSMTGQGIDEFFEAVQTKADEFRRDYQPELDRKRQEREEDRKKARQKELDQMMKGMSVDGQVGEDEKLKENEVEETDEPEDDDEYDDEGPDEEYDREGLQSRYAALTEDGVPSDASFAKYLHSQR
jgi:hypothetical protein